MAKLDIKKAAVDHGDKVVYGLLILAGLAAVATANWSSYDSTPTEIMSSVEKGEQQLTSHLWPDEERSKYAPGNDPSASPANIAHVRLFKERDASAMEMSAKMNVDILGSTEPVTEPTMLAVQDPLVSESIVYLAKQPEEEVPTKPVASEKTSKPQDERQLPDFLRSRGGTPAPEPAAEPQSYRALAQPLRNGKDSDQVAVAEEAKPAVQGEGHHFVAFRAVVPVKDQIREYAEAIHRNTYEASTLFDIDDFQLERQVKNSADGTFGPWEPVDLKVAKEICREAGIENEVVDTSITNSVITMPLPLRLTGLWETDATHPRIKDYQLSSEQIELQAQLSEKLLAELAEREAMTSGQESKKGGFANSTFDVRNMALDLVASAAPAAKSAGPTGRPGRGSSMSGAGRSMPNQSGGRSSMSSAGSYSMPTASGSSSASMSGANRAMPSGFGGSSSMSSMDSGRMMGGNAPLASRGEEYQSLIARLAGEEDSDERKAQIDKWLQERLSVEGELLLFRYFDFAVDSGKTYRYRVRLALQNPNFGRRPADAGGLEHVVLGETRWTPWSEISQPVTVRSDVKYYVTEVRDLASRVIPSVRLDTYQWDSKFGTFMNDVLEISLGQTVTERTATTVIDPAAGVYETKPYQFQSKDYVVDALADLKVDSNFHGSNGDAKYQVSFPVGSRGSAQFYPQAIVHSESGGLKLLDPLEQKETHETQKYIVEHQQQQFQGLKAPVEEESPVDSRYGDILGGGSRGGSQRSMPGGAGSRASSLQKRSMPNYR